MFAGLNLGRWGRGEQPLMTAVELTRDSLRSALKV